MMKKDANQQLRLLGQSVMLEEATTPYMIRTSMLIISLVVIAFFIWAAVAQIKEVAKTVGEIVPSGHIQTIQHLEGGIVEKILVQEDQIVEKDQVLLVMSGESIGSEYERVRTKQQVLAARRERILSFVEGGRRFGQAPSAEPISKQPAGASVGLVPERQPRLAVGGQDSLPGDLSLGQQKILEAMQQAREVEKQVISEQITQKNEQIVLLEREKKTVAENLRIAEAAFATQKELYDERLLSESEYLNTLKDKNDRVGERASLDIQIRLARQAVQEFEWRLKSLDAASNDKALQEVGLIEAEIAENSSLLSRLAKQTKRLELKAPVRGIVKGLEIHTVGGVLAPGQKLMEIVPMDSELIADIKISPADIGHIHLGDDVDVKVTSFDSARYGSVGGEITGLSATTFTNEQGIPYYKGVVRLKQDHVGSTPGTNTIMPGMIVNADIITGEKSLLAYLFKPIHISIESAFGER